MRALNVRASRSALLAVTGLALAGLVPGALASEASDGPRYRPVSRSTLVTRPEQPFVLEQFPEGDATVTALARQDAGAVPLAVVRLVTRRRHGQPEVAVQRLPAAGNDAAVLEQLYVLLVRQDPEGRYCVARGERPCEPGRRGVSHGQALARVAALRQRAVAGLQPAAPPWHMVSLASAALPKDANVDDVAARVTLGGRALPGVSLFFNRAPHSGCTARAGDDGVAACRLVDQHGDDDDHDAPGRVPVVVTFPGEVGVERVLPPTTFVLRAQR
jgi:hypothetical protein